VTSTSSSSSSSSSNTTSTTYSSASSSSSSLSYSQSYPRAEQHSFQMVYPPPLSGQYNHHQQILPHSHHPINTSVVFTNATGNRNNTVNPNTITTITPTATAATATATNRIDQEDKILPSIQSLENLGILPPRKN
jgi:hypothetical protein